MLGVHCAADTLKDDERWRSLLGGVFESHPWNAGDTVTLQNHAPPATPATDALRGSRTLKEEVYAFRNFDPDGSQVLASLDMARTSKKRPEHVPIAWLRDVGDGRVAYTSLGHRQDVWEADWYQQHLARLIAWAGGEGEGREAEPGPVATAGGRGRTGPPRASRRRSPAGGTPWVFRCVLDPPAAGRGGRAVGRPVGRVGRDDLLALQGLARRDELHRLCLRHPARPAAADRGGRDREFRRDRRRGRSPAGRSRRGGWATAPTATTLGHVPLQAAAAGRRGDDGRGDARARRGRGRCGGGSWSRACRPTPTRRCRRSVCTRGPAEVEVEAVEGQAVVESRGRGRAWGKSPSPATGRTSSPPPWPEGPTP